MRRRRRKVLSVVAVGLGIAVATAVGTIALDVGDRVNLELRSFGANISVTPAADGLAVAVGGVDYRPAGSGAFLNEADLVNLKRMFWKHNIVAFAPALYLPVIGYTQPAVLVGTWFDRTLIIDKQEVFRTGVKELHPAWRVEGEWPSDIESPGPVQCLVGRRFAKRWALRPGQSFVENVASTSFAAPARRTAPAPSITLVVSGILETGGPEDDEVIAPLAVVQKAAGLEGKIRRVEVSALTKPEDALAKSDPAKMSPEEYDRWYCTPYVRSIANQIQQAIPGAEAKPVYLVADTEGKILARVGILLWVLAAAALITAGLAVASMMLATVLERRAEIGLFKSLGATDSRVAAVFLLEASSIGLAGGVLGYFAGSLLAQRLSVQVFGLPTSMHWVFLPAALALALVVTLVGSALPLGRDLKLSPAMVLRNE
jgi:putative ABC transport system permease protein